jgi:hypothetical protein
VAGQNCDTTFIRRIGNYAVSERAFKVVATPEGNLLIGGSKANAALISLVTPSGQLIWERSFDMGFGDDFIYDMIIDADGMLVAIGRDLLTPANYSFILRFDYLTQTLLWSTKMANVTNPRFEALTKLPNGNYMVVGMLQAGSTGPDNLVLEVDKGTGNMVWQKTYTNGQTDVFLDVLVKNGSCYTANVQRYGGLEKIRAAVSKLDLTGNQAWTKNYIRNQTANARTYAASLETVNDSLVVFGHGNLNGSSDVDYSFQLFVTDLNGNIDWAKNYQLPGNNHLAGNVVVVPNGYVLSGTFSQGGKTEIFIMKVNRKGQKVWAKAIGSSENETCRSIAFQDGHIYFVGHSNVFDGSNDILFGRMSLNGEVLGASCGFVKDIQVTITNLGNPYQATMNMLDASGNYPMASTAVSPVAVASPIADVAGCGCQVFGGCTNLIVNPSFENGLAGWSATGNVTTTSDAKNGASAAIICGTADGSVSQIYPALQGDIFSASLWAKTINPPSNAFAQLRFLNAAFTPISQGSDTQYFTSTSYEHYNLNAAAPPGTAYVHFLVYKQGSQCTTFDDMEICKQTATQSMPDLNISNISLPTINANTVQAGSHLPVSFTLSNLGTGAAPSGFDVKIYVSSTPTLTTNSILLTSLSQQGLAAGSSINLSSSPVLSSSLTPGNYYLIVVADQANTVAESNESNNQASSQVFTVYGSCAMVASVSTATCHDNGTPNIVTDDYFSFKVSAINTLQSIGYNLLVLPTNQTLGIAYGVNYDITNMPISGGNVTLKFTDSLNSNCTQTLTVAAPQPCSVGLGDLVPSNLVVSNTLQVSSTYYFSFRVQNITTVPISGLPGVNHSLFLSTDDQFSSSDLFLAGDVFFNSYPANANQPFGLIGFNVPNVPAGNYYLILVVDKNLAIPESDETNNWLILPVTVQSAPSGGNIDLSLTVTSPATAPIYTSYPTTITVTNSGSIPATGVKVVCQKPNGVVYTGGNEFTASQGSFSPLNGQEWIVGTLAPGATATLTVNYFLLQSTLPVVYAQVTAANEPDADSTPNNGTPPTPNEDDEASSAGTPPPPPPAQPDLTLSGLTAPTSISPGLGNFTFTLKNIGTSAVQGSYQIGSFLSTDNVLSADDYAFATLPEQNTAVGSFNRTGSYDLPTGFATGNYYLIVKADVGNAIAEGNENNNTVSSPITVTGVICNNDYILNSQAEVDAFPGCDFVNGNLRIEGADIVDLTPLASLSGISGLLEIQNNTTLLSLDGLDNLATVGGLLMSGNPVLASLSPLANLHSDAILPLVIENQATLTNLHGLEGITGANYLRIQGNTNLQTLTGLDNLTIIRGEFLITQNPALLHLDQLAKLTTLQSTLILDDNPLLENLHGLSHLTSIGGTLFLNGTNKLTDLQGLQNVTSMFALDIKDNEFLQNLDAFSGITSLHSLRVRNNAVLSDCCGLYPILNANGVSGVIEISGNPNGCNSQLDIVSNCAPQGVDLQLAMTATNPNPGIYTSFPVKLTITNTGGQAATGVEVAFPRPAGVVYEGGNEFTASKGSFSAFGNERWSISDLTAGESATITVSYFLLTSNALRPYAQVVACAETDTDSSPNNGTPPTPNEDDEASIGINSFGNGTGSAVVRDDNRRRLIFDRIYPNPTQYLVVFDLYSYQQQTATLDIYDQQGRLVHSMQLDLEEGQNLVEVWVSDWKSGSYNLIARGEKSQLPAYGRFLKVWEE